VSIVRDSRFPSFAAQVQNLFLVFHGSDRRETLIPVTWTKAARGAVVKPKTKNHVCHREAAKV
jgi:hypothetical protein